MKTWRCYLLGILEISEWQTGIWLCLHLGTCWCCGGKANTYLKKSKFINFHWSSSMEKSLSTLDSNQLIPHQRNGKCLNVKHSSDWPVPTPHSSYLGSHSASALINFIHCDAGRGRRLQPLTFDTTAWNTNSTITLHLPATKLSTRYELSTYTQASLRASCHILTLYCSPHSEYCGCRWYRDINPNQ